MNKDDLTSKQIHRDGHLASCEIFYCRGSDGVCVETDKVGNSGAKSEKSPDDPYFFLLQMI